MGAQLHATTELARRRRPDAYGLAAEYWSDGLCFYDEKTRSRALIEQCWLEDWAGEIRIETKRGQAGVLLLRLLKRIEDDRISLGARPSGRHVAGIEAHYEIVRDDDPKASDISIRPTHVPSSSIEYYVSYAWGDDTPEGKDRETTVDRLCAQAEARRRNTPHSLFTPRTAIELANKRTNAIPKKGPRTRSNLERKQSVLIARSPVAAPQLSCRAGQTPSPHAVTVTLNGSTLSMI
jgi:hypothetical protein